MIFIFDHNDDSAKGYSAGVILNRPTPYTLGQIPDLQAFFPEFAENKLFLGGDVGLGRGSEQVSDKESGPAIQLLHGSSELEGSIEVISGVYMGGGKSAQQAVKDGRLNPEGVRCVHIQMQGMQWFAGSFAMGVFLHEKFWGATYWKSVQRLGIVVGLSAVSFLAGGLLATQAGARVSFRRNATIQYGTQQLQVQLSC